MSSKSIKDVLDLTEGLTDGQKLDIKDYTVGKDKIGKFAVITCVNGDKFKTYGEYIIEALDAAKAKKFPFGKDSLTCTVKEKQSENNRGYLVLTA
jgi:hypothetical protein